MTTAKTSNLTLAIAAAPMTLEDKLGWHFAMFDRISTSMLAVCAAAIRLHDAGFDESATMLDLPAGVTFEGSNRASIAQIINGHHLEPFLAIMADCLPATPLDAPLTHA